MSHSPYCTDRKTCTESDSWTCAEHKEDPMFTTTNVLKNS